MKESIRLGGLWESKSKSGTTFLSGNFTQGSRIFIHPNGFKKEGSSEPDYIMYLSVNEKRGEAEKPSSDSGESK